MPEKPEVITVVRSLKTKILNKKIEHVNVLWDNIIARTSVVDFENKLIDETIRDIKTRGKFIVIHLDKYILLIHLRMEGKFFFRREKDKIDKHEHVIFRFTDKEEMRFADVRKFGKMYLLDKDTYLNVEPLKSMGYEYDDKGLTKEYLFNKLNTKRIPIKTTLLDQSIICGIGNIYDDEILFMSKINPLRKSNLISLKECESIIKNTRIVLDKAIEKGGTTIKSFTSSEGVHGLFQNELLVHGKVGEKCPVCGSIIEKIKVNGRGTYFCPECQK